MKWIGQNIYDFISRFRNDVYLESISTGTIASGAHLGLDSSNKIVKAADGGGDLTSIVAGTGLSGTSLTGPIPTLNVDASQTQITGVGTIGTGVWQGTAVASAYLDADTAHLSGVQTFTGTKTFSADRTNFTSTASNSPIITVSNTTDNDVAGRLVFEKLRADDAVASGQNLGEIWFTGQDSAQNAEDYAAIIGEIDVSTSGQESGKLDFYVSAHDGSNGVGMSLVGGSQSGEVDVTVGLGVDSNTQVTGNLDTGGHINIAASHSYKIDDTVVISDSSGTATLSNIDALDATTEATIETAIDTLSNLTTVGTIGTGVWQGTAINQTYLVSQSGTNTGDETLESIEELAIRTVGTISTGTWQGTAIASAYLDADTMHYSAQRQLTHHTIKDDIGTGVIYISLGEIDAESGAKSNKNLPLLAPVAGKLLKVFLRTEQDMSGANLTWRLLTRAATATTSGNAAVIGTQSGTGPTTSSMATYDFTSSLDSGTNAIVAGDKVQLSIQSDASSADQLFFITCLWEWNLS